MGPRRCLFLAAILGPSQRPLHFARHKPPANPADNTTPPNPLLPNMFIRNSTRAKQFVAMALIGDGVAALVQPVADANAWDCGPKPWRKLMQYLASHPNLTRALGAAEIAAGLYLALKQEDSD